MEAFDCLMLPTTASDIIGMDFDWYLHTTANEIIVIKKPNLHKFLIFSPTTS